MSEHRPSPQPWLSPGQRWLTAAAVTGAAVVLLAAVVLSALWMLRAFIGFFAFVIWPLAVAGILAMLLRPAVLRLEKSLKLTRVRAILLLYFLVTAACLALGILLLPVVISQVVEIKDTLPDFITRAVHHLRDVLSQYPDIYQAVKSHLDEKSIAEQSAAATQHVMNLLLAAPSTARRLLEWSAALAVIPVYLFFLLETDRNLARDFRHQLTFLPPSIREDVVFLTNEFANIVVAFFRGKLVIGVIMGIMKAAGFMLIGLQGGFLLGMFFGLLNIVPYLGSILGLAVVLPIAYFQPGGSWTMVAEAAGIFAIVQLVEGYYLTPKIMGHHTGLHPLVILLSIFFWGEALHGILGMILAVPLTAFLVVAWRLLKTKYLPRDGRGTA